MAEKDVFQICGRQKVLEIITLAGDVVVSSAIQGLPRQGLRPCAVLWGKDGVIAIAAPQKLLQARAVQQGIKDGLHSICHQPSAAKSAISCELWLIRMHTIHREAVAKQCSSHGSKQAPELH